MIAIGQHGELWTATRGFNRLNQFLDIHAIWIDPARPHYFIEDISLIVPMSKRSFANLLRDVAAGNDYNEGLTPLCCFAL